MPKPAIAPQETNSDSATIRDNLTAQQYADFKLLVQQEIAGGKPEPEAVWPCLYKVNPNAFYDIVLPPENKTMVGMIGRRLKLPEKYKGFDIYEAARRITAASNEFHAEENTKNMARAWAIVLQASDISHAAAKKYLAQRGNTKEDIAYDALADRVSQCEHGANQVLTNIISKTRPPESAILATFFADENIVRRNMRLKKYLFVQPTPQVIEKLHQKIARFDKEQAQAAQKNIDADLDKIKKDLRSQVLPNKKAKSTVGRIMQSAATNVIDAGISAAISNKILQTPVIEQQRAEVDRLLGEDLVFIRKMDKLFSIGSETIRIQPKFSGRPIDLNNASAQDFTPANIAASVRVKTEQHLVNATEDVRDKSLRGGRIAGAVIIIGFVMFSVAAAIAIPPLIPFVIAANVFIALSTASYFYFSRDPISRAKGEIKNSSSTIMGRIMDFFTITRMKSNHGFEISADTEEFLRGLDRNLIDSLKTHFKNREAEIKSRLDDAVATQNKAAATSIKKDFDQLSNDWQQLINEANKKDTSQFVEFTMDYLQNIYITKDRPEFMHAAKERKQAWDSNKERQSLLLSSKHQKIEELGQIATCVTRIKTIGGGRKWPK